MVIVGFDPASIRNLGWSIIQIQFDKKNNIKKFSCSAGTIVLPLVDNHWEVLYPMSLVIDNFLLKNKPDIVVVEKTNNFQGPRGFVGGQISMSMGVILSMCGKYDLDVKFIFPTHCKKVLTGSGKAKKTIIKKSVKKHLNKLGIANPSYNSQHAYDAIGNSIVWMVDNGYFKNIFDS